MDRDLGVQSRVLIQQVRASSSCPLGSPFRRPGVLAQSSKAPTMPRRVSGGTAVSGIILLTLAVTISMQPRFLGLLSTQTSHPPATPGHPPATPDQAHEKVLRGPQQQSTDTVWTEVQGHAIEDSRELDIASCIP